MKEYERLTKKDQDWFEFTEINDIEIYRRLQDLENKIENGTLIELPCKIGDTAYCIYRNAEYEYWIEEEIVHDFIYTNYGEIDIGTECRMLGKVYRYCVYLTKAEAEKKLKELLGK